MGIVILPCFGDTKLNIYGLPTNYTLYAENGKLHKRVNIEDGVLLKNNPMGAEEISTLTVFAERINNVERTQDVNLFQQNIPKILLCDEENKLTLKNLVKNVMEFKFVILGRKSLSKMVNSSDVLDTTSPFLLEDLQKHKESLKNELLTYLGINNNNVEKKERLLVDEVNANNDFTNINIDLMLDMRERFCKEVNSKFGLNIKVSKREVESVVDDKVYSDDKRPGGEQR